MAENDTKPDDGSEAAPPRRFSLMTLIIMGVAGALSAAAGFAVPLLFPQVVDAVGIAPAARDATSRPRPPGANTPAYVSFGDIVVNLDEGRMNRYLRVSITLQVNKADQLNVEQLLATHRALLKSWLLSYLSDKDMEEIRGATGQNRLRREIQYKFNNVLFADGIDRIHDVLFEEFNVQ